MTKKLTLKEKKQMDRMFQRLMDHIGPILADAFNQQNDYIAEIMAKTIADAHKLILAASVDERREALDELKSVELSTDGGEAKKEEDDADDS